MSQPPARFRHVFRACLLAAALLAGPASAASATYQLDPVHTRVLFAISHAGFSQAMGTVSGSTGLLQFDPDDWSQSRVEVTVPLDRADLGDPAWNKAVAAGNLLDSKDHSQATFVSTRVVGIDATHAHVIGNLTLHGVTREVTLEVTFNQLKRHPLPPFRRTAGFSATTTISRADFGITAWKSVIGDAVQLTIQAEATRSGQDFDAPNTPVQDGAAPASDPAPSLPANPPQDTTP
ncbi:YceI family protein [Pseudoxanthomonas sp. GM95]|uniref:YceI family protein n=1 Tax=Pseudoxanthomonas sp. GM95 TaxID=1881043 RepID=UPI000B81E578|nr:YceI family protein [Pseudoxanthomonas sp. GM95]